MGQGQAKTTYDSRNMTGKVVIITGGNAGIGVCAAKDLAMLGANVVITSRNEQRGNEAVEKLTKELKEVQAPGTVSMELLDLTKLKSVEAFAERWGKRKDTTIDVLINNAGIMMPFTRELTEDGFEAQFGTNHIGHYVLTGRLMPFITATKGSRIVNVSSIKAASAKRPKTIDFRRDENYQPGPVYDETKLANLLFTLELSKRYPSVMCLSAHPGVSATGLFAKNQYKNLTWMFQYAEVGAHSLVRAAAEDEVTSTSYFGPTWFGGWRGEPYADIPKPPLAQDEDLAAEYWAATEKATSFTF